jgi:hypothetical protein
MVKMAHFMLYVFNQNKSNKKKGQALVAHTCNCSYSGGRDQEDRGSKPTRANSSARPYPKKPFTIGLVEWVKVKPLSSGPSTTKKKKKKKRK